MVRTHRRSLLLPAALLSLLVLALLVGLPSPAAASSGTSAATEAAAFQGPVAPTIALPGVFSLNLGQGFSVTSEGLTLDSAEVAIPAVDAVAHVDGLTLDQNFRLKDWGAITLIQNTPRETEMYSVSNAALAVGGPGSGFSTVASATVDLHGSEMVDFAGTIGVAYDGLARKFGAGMRNADMAVQAGPLNVTLTGANSQAGGLTVDNASASIDGRDGAVAVSGLQFGPAGLDWETLDVSVAPMAVGNALAVSPAQVRVGGSTTGYATTGAVGLAFNAGNAVQGQGDVIATFNPTTRTTQFALENAGVQFGVGGFSLGLDGMDLGAEGTSVDTISLQADQVGLSAEVSGFRVEPTGQAAFDSATIQYQPQGEKAAPGSGFVLQIDQTDAGYVLTTTTLLPGRQ